MPALGLPGTRRREHERPAPAPTAQEPGQKVAAGITYTGLIVTLVAPFWVSPCVGDAQHQPPVLAPRAYEQELDMCTLPIVLLDTQVPSREELYRDGALDNKGRVHVAMLGAPFRRSP